MPDPNVMGDPGAADPAAASPPPTAQPTPQPGAPTGANPGPAGAPMLGPNKQLGKQQSAKIKVQVAIHALMLAAQETGVMSDEGRAILDAIQKLTKQFGKSEDQSKQLVPAELAQILQQSKPGAMNPALAGAVRPQAPPPMAA